MAHLGLRGRILAVLVAALCLVGAILAVIDSSWLASVVIALLGIAAITGLAIWGSLAAVARQVGETQADVAEGLRVASRGLAVGRDVRREGRATSSRLFGSAPAQSRDQSLLKTQREFTVAVTRVADLVEHDRVEQRLELEVLSREVDALNCALTEPLKAVEEHIAALERLVSEQARVATFGYAPVDTADSATDGEAGIKDLRRILVQLRDELRGSVGTPAAAQRRRLNEYAQLEALMDLRDRVTLAGPAPSTRGWAAAPSTLLAVLGCAEETDADLIVECGSGASTIWIASFLRKRGKGRLVSLEHEAKYLDVTRRLVATHGLEDVVELRLAPISTLTIDGEEHEWYAADAVSDLEGINVVFVDGPPGHMQPLARYPAGPVLTPRCAPGFRLVLDDSEREEEIRIAELWREQRGLVDVAASELEKGWRILGAGPS